jgi:hypothetical protein
MIPKPRINQAAIDLLARHFNTHRKGIPEWLKNAREAYLRAGVPAADRLIILNYVKVTSQRDTYLECIDFVGISGTEIDERYLEWANPEAALAGMARASDIEGGQGNGGKAYLRQMFERGYFTSIRDGMLSVVSFLDKAKHVLGFVPDDAQGKDSRGDNPAVPRIREYAEEWLKALGYAPNHNITIVRGLTPRKTIDADRLLEEIQQFPQARQTIETCKVQYFFNGEFRRELQVKRPALHPAFPNPVVIPVPIDLPFASRTIKTARLPDYPQGNLELSVAQYPLRGQAYQSWNRIDFHAGGVRVIGWKPCTELPLQQAPYAHHLFGKCTVPLLADPSENYEGQARERLIEGPLSESLYGFIAQEADKLLVQLAKQEQSSAVRKKRRKLEALNERLSRWIENKLSTLEGLSEGGNGDGGAGRKRQPKTKKEHADERSGGHGP